MSNITAIAERLDIAKTTVIATPQLETVITIDEAYKVQFDQLRRHQERGERYLGPKLGFTSRSKMEQMGVDSIIVGFLTDAMELDPAVPVELGSYIHPRIEPELVFRLEQAVPAQPDEDPQSLADRIRAATVQAAVGMEIIDSRYKDFKFSLTDVVADNTSAAGFVIGQWHSYPRQLSGLTVEFEVEGQVIHTATTNAILGDPEEAFLELAKMILEFGFELPAGAIILAGSMTPAASLDAGQVVTARVGDFPELIIRTASA